MKKLVLRKRTRWIIGCAMVLALACVVAYAVFHHYHPTHYRFNDYEVIGHTVEEIIDRYGQYDTIFFNNDNAYETYDKTDTSSFAPEDVSEIWYKVKDRYITSWGLKYPTVYYAVHFENGDGIASRVSLEQYGGLDWL